MFYVFVKKNQYCLSLGEWGTDGAYYSFSYVSDHAPLLAGLFFALVLVH